MRRILLAGAIAGALVSAAACDATTQRPASPPSPARWASPSASPTAGSSAILAADIRRVCGEIDKSLEGEMRSVGAELGKMIAHRQAGDTARADRSMADTQAKLRTMAARMRQRTSAAQYPEVTAALRKTAANINVTARNDAFFARFKSTQGAEVLLQREVVRWLTPLTESCAA